MRASFHVLREGRVEAHSYSNMRSESSPGHARLAKPRSRGRIKGVRSGELILRWSTVSAFILVIFFCRSAGAADPDTTAITRTLQDASRALQSRNAALFLSFFDRKRFADYPQLESNAVALTRQADIASSIEVTQWKQQGDEHLGTLDWILQITLISGPGEIKTRRAKVSLRVAKVKGRWKIVALHPVEFFRPL